MEHIWSKHPYFGVAKKIYQKLADSGYPCLFAGGCVRDGLLQKIPKDFDLVTMATPEQVEQLFPQTLPVGKKFGIILVVEEQISVEVATFRKEGSYTDGRHPQAVEFCVHGKIEEAAQNDATRRDFTINSLFYDLKNKKVLDYVGGVEDLLENKIIRAIGDPLKRFQEDHLRMLRALRFLAQLRDFGFSLEPRTIHAIQDQIDSMNKISGERIKEEMEKILQAPHPEISLSQWYELGFGGILFPNFFGEKLSAEQKISLKKRIQEYTSREFLSSEMQVEKLEFLSREMQEEKLKNEFEAWDFFLRWITFCHFPWSSGEFHQLTKQMRFSSDLKRKLTQSWTWKLQPLQFVQFSLGELIEKSFLPEFLYGLKWLYKICQKEESLLFLSEKEKEKFIIEYPLIISQLEKYNYQKPDPLVKSVDLKGLSGPSLGQALRQIYFWQLENKITLKQEGIQKFYDLHSG